MPCIKHKVRLIQYVYYMNEQNSIQHEVKKKELKQYPKMYLLHSHLYDLCTVSVIM